MYVQSNCNETIITRCDKKYTISDETGSTIYTAFCQMETGFMWLECVFGKHSCKFWI